MQQARATLPAGRCGYPLFVLHACACHRAAAPHASTPTSCRQPPAPPPPPLLTCTHLHPLAPTCTHLHSPVDSYVENVNGEIEVEVNAPYIMYTHGDDQVCPASSPPCPSCPLAPLCPRPPCCAPLSNATRPSALAPHDPCSHGHCALQQQLIPMDNQPCRPLSLRIMPAHHAC